MVDKVKSPKKLLPIFHQGEDFRYLRQMLEYKYTREDVKGQPIDYIGVSCNKELTTQSWIEWFCEVYKIIRDSSNPNVKTHAFGMTSLKVLEQFPFTSADSTSWVRSAGFGNILVGYTSVYTSDRNPDDPGHINNLSPALQEDIDKICKKYGFTLKGILDDTSGQSRALFNLCSLKEWANNYEYRGNDEYEEDLW